MKLKRSPIESPILRGYRELLGVGASPTADELKKAYRRLVSLYHPDKNLENPEDPYLQAQFLKVTEAYEILGDPEKREKLNRGFLDKRLYDFPIEGINISFGAFFGYRTFNVKRVNREKRLGRERAGEKDGDLGFFDFKSEESQSILDNPAFDSIELVYAGKFSLGDEERILGGFKGATLGALPWVMLNNQGLIYFLEEKFIEALECYEELNRRIPNNIIFMYRLALCHTILAFKKKIKRLLGKDKPDPKHLKAALDGFRRAILLGETRVVGKQKCLTIRKTLADVFEKAGMLKQSRKIWQDIRYIDPRSSEAAFKLGAAQAKRLT